MFEVNELLGMKVNVIPLTTSAVAVTLFVNVVDVVVTFANPSPIILPAFLLPKTAVYPPFLLPAGDVEGLIGYCPPVVFAAIVDTLIETIGNFVVPFGKVTNLYFNACVSSGDASKIGVFKIELS
jgi:hypothetical protein